MANGGTERQASLSSDKLLAILECVAESRVPMRLQDIAEKSSMSQPTVLRYLRTLQNANYVYQEEQTLRYGLTWKLCGLTENRDSHLGLRNIAGSFVSYLANTLQLGVCLVVGKENESIYLDCIDPVQAPHTPLQHIGKLAPLHTTASGKILLSTYTPIQLNNYIEGIGLKKYTDHTIIQPQHLMDELEKVRQQGYAIDDEECEPGLRCVSFPLYSYTGRVCAAISVFGPSDEMQDEDVLDTVFAELRSASQKISARLGYQKED